MPMMTNFLERNLSFRRMWILSLVLLACILFWSLAVGSIVLSIMLPIMILLVPQLVQPDQIFVDGTPGLDDGGIFQDRPEYPCTGIAVPRMMSFGCSNAIITGRVHELHHQTGGAGCQLDHRCVGKGVAVGRVGMLRSCLGKALDVKAEKTSVVGNVPTEPLVDLVGIIRVGDRYFLLLVFFFVAFGKRIRRKGGQESLFLFLWVGGRREWGKNSGGGEIPIPRF